MQKHIDVLQDLRDQRYTALKEALELRQAGVQGQQAAGLRSLCRGLLREIRALDAAVGNTAMTAQHEKLFQVLSFYADPESYLAIGFFPDRPCGGFIDDFSDTDLGFKPGKLAREALKILLASVKR